MAYNRQKYLNIHHKGRIAFVINCSAYINLSQLLIIWTFLHYKISKPLSNIQFVYICILVTFLNSDFSPITSTRRFCFWGLFVWLSVFKITLGGPWWHSGNTLTSHLWNVLFKPQTICENVGSCLPMVAFSNLKQILAICSILNWFLRFTKNLDESAYHKLFRNLFKLSWTNCNTSQAMWLAKCSFNDHCTSLELMLLLRYWP